MIEVALTGNMEFTARSDEGGELKLDAYADAGGSGAHLTPVEALLASAAACGGMDVISILRKKQQTVTTYRIEIEHERGPMGEWPRPVTHIHLRHVLTGPNLDPAAVDRAIELSDEKYCSVLATLRNPPTVTTDRIITS